MRIFGEGWERKIFAPQYLPQFWTQGAEIFSPLDIHGTQLRSEFRGPNPKNGAWGDDRRN